MLYELTLPSLPLSSPDRPIDESEYEKDEEDADLAAGREYVLALGGEEVRLTYKDGKMEVSNIDHLRGLYSEDLLSLRIYLNHDPANVLWRFAFSHLAVEVDANRDGEINRDSVDPEDFDLSNPGDLTEEEIAALRKSDAVSPERPFRFWLNDDYDVVVENNGTLGILTSWIGSDPFERDSIKMDQVVCNKVVNQDNERDESCIQNDKVLKDDGQRVTNSDEQHRQKIESFRDLEDFAPLVVRLAEATYDQIQEGDLVLRMEARGIGINLFHGTWERQPMETHPRCEQLGNSERSILWHLEDCEAAFMQTREGLHVGYLAGHESGSDRYFEPDTSQIEEWFERDDLDGSYIGRFLFEGIDPSVETCTPEDASDCYFQVTLFDAEERTVIGRVKTYIDLQHVKHFYDHFTTGTWIECQDTLRDADGHCRHDPTVPASDLYSTAVDVHAGEAHPAGQFHQNVGKLEKARYRQQWTGSYSYRRPVQDLLRREDEELPYIMLVHGWRMPYAERVNFAETAFKRLYWQGYQGRFGFFSWPTSWMQKTPNVNFATSLAEVLQDLNNYSRSERIARDSAPMLKSKLQDLKGQYKELHLFAHSMGNVVVSEALREANGTVLDTYVATQAATSAGAYAGGAALPMLVTPAGKRDLETPRRALDEQGEGGSTGSFWGDVTSWLGDLVDDGLEAACVPFNRMSFENAWRCVNLDEWSNNWYDVPPDWYQQQVEQPRHERNATLDVAYYANISQRVEERRVINFFNERDFALDGWNLQQITKPDRGQEGTEGSWAHDTLIWNLDACDEDPRNCQVVDLFASPEADPDPQNPATYDLHWDVDSQRKAIMSFILPSRTYALGATAELSGFGEIGREVNLASEFGYTNSAFDHSKQWFDSYVEQRLYWFELNDAFFGGAND